MQSKANQSSCIVCNGMLGQDNIATIDIAGYVSLIDSNPIASIFYRLDFLFFLPKLRQKILNYKYFITSNSDLLNYKQCMKCDSLNLTLKKERSLHAGQDDIKYFSEPKDCNKKGNEYIKYFSKFIANIFSKYKFQNGKVLDVGSGNGEIVSVLRTHDIDAVGIEPSIGQFTASVENSKIYAKNEYYSRKSYKKKSFCLIYSYHSIEHFLDFEELFLSAFYHLQDDGVLCISTPVSELAIKYAQNNTKRYFSSATEVLFCSSHEKILSKKIILQRAKEHGFSPKRIIENPTSKISEFGEKPAGCTFIFEKSRPVKTHHL